MKNIKVKGSGFFCSLSTQIYNINLSVGFCVYSGIWSFVCSLYLKSWVLWAWPWSWLHDLVGRDIYYPSFLHYEQLAAETQLRVYLGLDFVFGSLLS